MPKSKRRSTKALTNTNKKGRELKSQVVESIRGAIDAYKSVYVFSYENMRTNHFKEVRVAFRDSRFFLGKNKVMKVALGRSNEEEYLTELSKTANDIEGSTGVLCTNQSQEDVEAYFAKTSMISFAKSGFAATETITIPAGFLSEFVGSMYESLHKLGLPVFLNKGQLELTEEYTICTQGEMLTPERAKLLVHFDTPMAEFKLNLVSRWTEGKYTAY